MSKNNKKTKKAVNKNENVQEIPVSNDSTELDKNIYVEYDGKEDFDVFFNRLTIVQKLAFFQGMLYGSLSFEKLEDDEEDEGFTMVEDEEQFQLALGILDTMINNNCEMYK